MECSKDDINEARCYALAKRKLLSRSYLSNGNKASNEVGAKKFVASFFRASRLHFIGTWKQRFQEFISHYPEPPKHTSGPESETWILHVDMDAFFASVSVCDLPQLRNVPIAICWGESSGHSEISCANYAARRHNVRAGEWMKIALKKCPDLVTFPFEFEKYTEVGLTLYSILLNVVPFVQGLSCDEAFLDVSSIVPDNTESSVKAIAEDIRSLVYSKTKCTVSIGAGRNMFLARLATKNAKPNGFFCIDECYSGLGPSRKKLLHRIGQLKVGELPSIGYSTTKVLNGMNIYTCADLQKTSEKLLTDTFGDKLGVKMYKLCRGIDGRPWKSSRETERKSISSQISYGVRMKTENDCVEFLDQLSSNTIDRLINDKSILSAKSVSLKVWKAKANANPYMQKGFLGHGQCNIIQRQKKYPIMARDRKSLAHIVFSIFKEMKIHPEEVRGMGITLSDLVKRKPNSIVQAFQMARKTSMVSMNISSGKNVDILKAILFRHSSPSRLTLPKIKLSKKARLKQRKSAVNWNEVQYYLSCSSTISRR